VTLLVPKFRFGTPLFSKLGFIGSKHFLKDSPGSVRILRMISSRTLLLGASFIIGMAAATLIAGSSLRALKRMDEFVSVKGLSEREMPADLAIWPIVYSMAEDDLTKLEEKIDAGRQTIRRFLEENGFEAKEITNTPPQITERQTNAEDEEDGKRAPRYRANVTVLLRTTKVQAVKSAMETCDKLVKQGIALGGNDYSNRAQFLFTGLNQVKPDMIQEANRNARKAAEKFGADSNSRVGSIRHAVQGPFEINDVDSSTPDRKIVRVVTTVDFYLQ
jgi:hypothetical protein